MTEAEILFSQALNCDRMYLYRNRSLLLNTKISSYISTVLKRRIQGEPIQYILGNTEFMGLEFQVRPGVLIPRQETEILVETVVKEVTKLQSYNVTTLNLLDLGTGSGCIAISLAKFLTNVKIDAIDISEAALAIAKENAVINQVNERIAFIRADLFAPDPMRHMLYDFIISNPPYVASEQILKLQPEIAYEPKIALDGGEDGLDFYRRIALSSGKYLKKKGILAMEIGCGQLEGIKNIFHKAKNFEIIEVIKDYNNIDRVVIIEKR
ncbi:MAG: peptide chain release factor N(5)-glutamine methyltransferase [Candidatus Omnitrophica bacterium]|nr:peptide chain release factor N(5)-glutamine methyltransferase [Candidatus Omnitrophota bacterium]